MANGWDGKERRGAHNCVQEETIGRFKEFMDSMKGLKATLFVIAMSVLIQVGTFLFLWGSLTETVKYHGKNIDQIMSKLDKVKIVGYAIAGENISNAKETETN